jgi:hypothetical protein
MNSRLLSPILFCLPLLLSVNARAQWTFNGAPVAVAPGTQNSSVMVPDGSNGAFVVWQDQRGLDYDVYAQHVDAFGNAIWASNGVPVITNPGNQSQPLAATDGAGGIIVVWEDTRNGANFDIYAQRINASGVTLWSGFGVAINTLAGSDQIPFGIVSDGVGGAIVVFTDNHSGNFDIYAQRINYAGVTQWTAGGVAVCTSPGQQTSPVLATDGANGAIVAWQDGRGVTTDIYAQHLNSAGVAQWTANGLAVCTAINNQSFPSCTSDGVGGAILAWDDYRGNASLADIYAQRLNSSGTALWTAGGQLVCGATDSQFSTSTTSDGSQGAVIAWQDNRAGNYDIYAQRMSAIGAPMWTGDGVAQCTASGNQLVPLVASDGTGGAFVAWSDSRNPMVTHVYMQHTSASGAVQWTTDGVAISGVTNSQNIGGVMNDGAGNAIVGWSDFRNGQNYDVYAQRVEGMYGYWGHPEPNVTSVRDIRGDQGGKVAVDWQASQRDVSIPRTISYYDIWRATDSFPFNMTIGSPSVITNLKDVREAMKGPVYYAAPATSSSPPYYWELVGTQGAHGFSGYTFSASTRADSVATGSNNEAFMVSAHISGDDYVAFTSNVLTGHSVDNLAPPAPLFLTALRVSADVHLKWNGVHVADLKNYTVYRATSTGVTPIPVNFLANDTDTVLVDASAPGSALYYIVTANDVHGNQGTKSNEASVSATTGVGNLPPITALTVLQNHPNPFTGETQLQVGLPLKEDVRVEIYDVAGRRVRDVSISAQSKGWNTLRLNARDDHGVSLPSGVYFYRVHAGNETVTRKMVIAR